MRKVKLSWEDQIKMKEKKKEDIINMNQSERHQSIAVKVHKRSAADDSNKADAYDLYLIEKALNSLKKEFEIQSAKNKEVKVESIMELDFHEQYFS